MTAGVRIDNLPASVAATRTHVVPAMKDGATVRLTVGQMLDLVIGAAPGQLDTLQELADAINDDANFAATVTAALALKANKTDTDIHTLPAKTPAVDADEFRIADSAASFGSKRLTFANMIASIFTSTRKIPNAVFQDDVTFFSAAGLTKGFKFVASAITAGATRLVTLPDYNIDLGFLDVKAWVNFNGTGTVAIRASKNVSSITDNGVGDYTVNFATAMADANYAVVPAGGSSSADTTVSVGTTPTTSACRLTNVSAGVVADNSAIHVAVFR